LILYVYVIDERRFTLGPAKPRKSKLGALSLVKRGLFSKLLANESAVTYYFHSFDLLSALSIKAKEIVIMSVFV